MNRPIKVLQVMGSLNRGGAESMVMNLYRSIDSHIVHFDFVTHGAPDGAFAEEIRSKGGTIYSCPKYLGYNHFKYSKWWKSFFEIHKEYRIVHSHIRSTAIIIFDKAKKNDAIKIIHSHSTSNGKGIEAILKRILQYPLRFEADYFFGCSKEAATWLFGEDIVNNPKYHMIKNAIDTKLYILDEQVRNEYRIGLNIQNDCKILIHVGRFHESKNHEFIVDIVYNLINQQVNCKLVLVGDGELRKHIEDKVKKIGLKDKVLFLGIRNDVPNLLKMSDAFVFPSLWEGLPVSVVEAQAAGLPCYISDRITRDVNITDLVHNLPIEDGSSKWANAIKEGLFTKRENTMEEIKKSGFDITESADWLVKFYVKIAREKESNER